jgi:hypothetical protein
MRHSVVFMETRRTRKEEKRRVEESYPRIVNSVGRVRVESSLKPIWVDSSSQSPSYTVTRRLDSDSPSPKYLWQLFVWQGT